MGNDNNPYVNQFGIESGEELCIEHSPTPAPDEENVGKPRKRLVKKSVAKSLSESGNPTGQPFGGEDFDDRKEEEPVKKRKSSSGKIGNDLSVKNKMKELPKQNQSGENVSSSRAKRYEVCSADHVSDPELQELWNHLTNHDLQGKEDNEESEYLKIRENVIKVEKSPVEIARIVEDLMAQFEVAVEEDFELNRQNKPAINKLNMIPLLQEALSKKKLQLEFLDHGILTLLGNWLEPMPDGSLPNMTIRTAILQLLFDFPVDLEQYDHREQLKQSGLGKVVMFLSKYDEECKANRKLAKELVDRWSRSIFNKSARYEDLRNHVEERISSMMTAPKRPANKSLGKDLKDGDSDEFFQRKKSRQSSVNERVTLPEAGPLDFVVRPPSKITQEQLHELTIKESLRAQQEKKQKKRRRIMKRLATPWRRPSVKVLSSMY